MKIIKLVIVLSLSILVSCNKEDESILLTQNGSVKLESIEYRNGLSISGQLTTELFNYDNDRLINVEHIYYTNTSKEFIYDSNNRLLEILTTNENEILPISKDSLVYNSKGEIIRIIKFDSYTTSLEIFAEIEFEYDNEGQIIKNTYTSLRNQIQIYTITEYEWENGNIVKSSDYDSNNTLLVDWFYEYDNKLNYKKNNPYFLENILDWTANNPIKSTAEDHSGLLDLICNPCTAHYDYKSDLPTKIKYEWNYEIIVKYAEK